MAEISEREIEDAKKFLESQGINVEKEAGQRKAMKDKLQRLDGRVQASRSKETAHFEVS